MKDLELNKNYSGPISTLTIIDFSSSSFHQWIFFFFNLKTMGNHCGKSNVETVPVFPALMVFCTCIITFFKCHELKNHVVRVILFYYKLNSIFCLQITHEQMVGYKTVKCKAQEIN